MSETESRPAPSQLRRLPWTEDGKPAYLSTDGGSSLLSSTADAMEESMLVTAEIDVTRALSVADDVSASRAELRLAVHFLSRAVVDTIEVARLRGERLPLDPEAKETAEFLRHTLAP